MTDDLVKRARAQMAKGAEHLARTGGEVTQAGFVPLLCDRIEELQSRMRKAEVDISIVAHWFDTDQEILDAMAPPERADHKRQEAVVKRALAALRGDNDA